MGDVSSCDCATVRQRERPASGHWLSAVRSVKYARKIDGNESLSREAGRQFGIACDADCVACDLVTCPQQQWGQYNGRGRHNVEDRRHGNVPAVAHCTLCTTLLSEFERGDTNECIRSYIGDNLWKARMSGFLPVEASGSRKVNYKLAVRGRS